jgi:hypothetical protein
MKRVAIPVRFAVRTTLCACVVVTCKLVVRARTFLGVTTKFPSASRAPIIDIDGVADMLLCEVTGKLCFYCAVSMAVADTVLFLARSGGLSGVEHFYVLPVAALRHVFRLYVCMRSSNFYSKPLLWIWKLSNRFVS